MRKELEAAKLALAAIAADRDNLKQQLDALQKPAPAPAGDKAKDRQPRPYRNNWTRRRGNATRRCPRPRP